MPKQKIYLDRDQVEQVIETKEMLALLERRTVRLIDMISTSNMRNAITELNLHLMMAATKCEEILAMPRETPNSEGG